MQFVVSCLTSRKSRRRSSEASLSSYEDDLAGIDASNVFPVQIRRLLHLLAFFFSPALAVSALFDGISGSVRPWVQLSAANVTDPGAQFVDSTLVILIKYSSWQYPTKTIDRSITSTLINQHWFVSCTRGCYTGGETLFRRTIDSLAQPSTVNRFFSYFQE